MYGGIYNESYVTYIKFTGGTVSYTHLDVYKRQEHHYNLFRTRKVKITLFIFQQFNFSFFLIKIILIEMIQMT